MMGVGSNLVAADGAGPLQNCERALRAVANLPGVFNMIRSRWYSSAPVPPSAQGRYVNGMAGFVTALSPEELLAGLQSVEQAAGRVRSVPNAPRVLDLDIIAVGGLVREAPDPIVPHPRAHLRGFVLLPLRDVAPFWVHPLLGLSAAQLLAGLPAQDVRPC